MIEAVTDSKYSQRFQDKVSVWILNTIYILSDWNGPQSVIKEHFVPLKELENVSVC